MPKAAAGEQKVAKRPQSAYIFFSNDQRDVVKKEKPALDVKGITTELGARWQKLTAEQKKKYDALAATDKARYAKVSDVMNEINGQAGPQWRRCEWVVAPRGECEWRDVCGRFPRSLAPTAPAA
jgi:hypothetical protein